MIVMIQTSKNTILSFSATDLYVTPFNCRPKPKICHLKPVICRPAQEHSHHESAMYCRAEPPCVVTDIPKRDIGCLSKSGPEHVKNYKAANPAVNVRPSLARQRNVISNGVSLVSQ